MPGCSGIWPVIVAIFAINALGIEYSALDYAILAVLALAVSFGTAGVPGTATITATAVFTAAGLPIEVIVLLTPINAIADMARTATNVTAAAVSAAIVARKEGGLDDALFESDTALSPGEAEPPSPAGEPAINESEVNQSI
jgi:Na+/H+-dicarboxylate symporter